MQNFLPETLLVTGGAGFIGSNFVRYLFANDAQIRVVTLDKLTYAGSPDNLADLEVDDRHTLIEGDIGDAALVSQLLQDYGVNGIVHFAAESHVDRSIAGPREFIDSNVVGTYVLLEAAHRYWADRGTLNRCRFHHISTDEVYGSLGRDEPPFRETTPYAPNSPYSASKAASDHLVRAWHHTYGLPVVTTNCSNNYGPRQHAEKLIPTVIRCCVAAQEIPVYGDGSNIRDWLYVDDHCAAIDLVLRRGRIGETYNVGGLNEWSNNDIVRLICDIFDERRPAGAPHAELIRYVTDRPGHDWRYAINAGKIIDELGWQPAETFETGIRKTIDWYLARD